MKFQKRRRSLILTACCFCLTLILFSSTAFAAEAGDSIRFADVYGLEIADGASQKVTFESPRSEYSIKIDKDTSVEAIIKKLNVVFGNFDYTVSYDAGSGQLIMTDADNNRVDLKVFVDGEELTPKPSVSTATMPDLLATIGRVLSAAMLWVSAVADIVAANPVFLLGIVIGFIGTGILLFRRLLNL